MIDRTIVLKLIRDAMMDDEEVDEFLIDLGDVELSRMVFHAPSGSADNLRLSSTGYGFLKNKFETYEQHIDKDYVITARDLLFLKQNCQMPYYLCFKPKSLFLFERELALRVKIVSGQLASLH